MPGNLSPITGSLTRNAGGPAFVLPRVSIVILHWNREQETAECLESLSRLHYPNYELLLVDNGSADGSAQRLARRFPQLRLLRNPRNLGFAEGCNVGIRAALARGARWVLLLNNDTIASPDFLCRLVAVGESDQSIGVVSPVIYYHSSPDLIWFAGGRINWEQGSLSHRTELNGAEGQKWLEAGDYIVLCAALIRRSAFLRAGLLAGCTFLYWEDVEFGCRLRRYGFRLVTAPGAKIWHKVAATSGGGESRLSLYYYLRNSLIFFRRQMPPARWLRLYGLTVYYLLRQRLPMMIGSEADGPGRFAALGMAFLHALLGKQGPGPFWLTRGGCQR